jgi:hypothetical protein
MFQSLVANGMFHCLVANGMWKKNTFSPLLIFPPTTYLNLQFFDLEVLFYHGYRSLLTPFLRFPQSINYDYTFRCNKSFTLSLSIWFWLKIWLISSPWNHGVAHGHILRAPSRTSKWRIAFGVISRSHPNVTSSWWKTRTLKSACLSWNWTPSSLKLSYFSELSHHGDFVASRPYIWWWTWNHMWSLL